MLVSIAPVYNFKWRVEFQRHDQAKWNPLYVKKNFIGLPRYMFFYDYNGRHAEYRWKWLALSVAKWVYYREARSFKRMKACEAFIANNSRIVIGVSTN